MNAKAPRANRNCAGVPLAAAKNCLGGESLWTDPEHVVFRITPLLVLRTQNWRGTYKGYMHMHIGTMGSARGVLHF
jgi:hypothetical protein